MTKLIYWTPRLLAVAFILFISLFALDAVKEGPVALLMHLRLSLLLTLLLVVAWKREWVGALFFGLAGAYYIATTIAKPALEIGVKLNWSLVIGAPALLIALLFWMAWRTRTAARA